MAVPCARRSWQGQPGVAWPKACPQNMLFPTLQQLERGTASSSWAGGKTSSIIQAAAHGAAVGRAVAGLPRPMPLPLSSCPRASTSTARSGGPGGAPRLGPGERRLLLLAPPGVLHPQPRWLWQLTWELRSFDGIPQRDTGLLTSKTSQSCKANSRLSPGACAQAATSPCEGGAPRGTPREESGWREKP